MWIRLRENSIAQGLSERNLIELKNAGLTEQEIQMLFPVGKIVEAERGPLVRVISHGVSIFLLESEYAQLTPLEVLALEAT